MATINISLPDNLKTFVERRVKKNGFGTTSGYFQALIHSDKQRKAQERLEELLLEGLRSGPSRPFTKADWAAINKAVQERAKANKRSLPSQ